MSSETKQRKQKIVNLSTMGETDPEIKKWLALGVPPGQFGTVLPEKNIPLYDPAGCEKIMEGSNNSIIVLGRDRHASLASGFGGRGGTNCGMIDIMVGRLAGLGDSISSSIKSGPNFALDAARIYLTQKGDVDKYFAIPKGNSRIPSTLGRSSVGIKSDHTRMIGRQSVKIFAGKGNWEGTGKYGEPNSSGGDIKTSPVIELVAGHHDDIQPAVLGDNLKQALEAIYKTLRSIVAGMHTTHFMGAMYAAKQMGDVHAVTGAGLLGVGLAAPNPAIVFANMEHFIKSMNGQFDTILKQFNIYFDQMDALGMGPDAKKIPGAKDICSKNVFIT